MADLTLPAVGRQEYGRQPPAPRTAIQFRLIFIAGFAVFLLVALLARLLPRRRRPWLAGTSARLSIVEEAKVAAHTFLPLAFLA